METGNDKLRNLSECATLSFKDSWLGHDFKEQKRPTRIFQALAPIVCVEYNKIICMYILNIFR